MKKCRMCGIEGTWNFKEVLDMGHNPLVNSLLEKEELQKNEEVYPLVVEQCQNCSLVQIVEPIESEKIYRATDYLYFSGDMPGLKDYFKEYAEDIKKRFINKGKDDLFVEIGSNDGLFLGLMNDEARVLGVDPASNVTVRALARDLPTVSDYFSERLAKSIKREFGHAKVVMGNNCIAHLNSLEDLMRGVATLLKPDAGVFAVECNYWGGMVKNDNYSLVYHDHFSYFTVKNWMDFAPKFGLKVFDAIITPSQGGTLRIFMTNSSVAEETERFKNLCQEEIESGLAEYGTCREWRDRVVAKAMRLHELVSGLKEQGKTIVGYGAAAKGFSILKLAKIDQRLIDYFVDDSPAKQNKFTPITHIPVISRKLAESNLPDYFFITAPNYEQIIIDKEKDYVANGGKFITQDCRVIG